MGTETVGMPPEEFTRVFHADLQRWAKFVRSSRATSAKRSSQWPLIVIASAWTAMAGTFDDGPEGR